MRLLLCNFSPLTSSPLTRSLRQATSISRRTMSTSTSDVLPFTGAVVAAVRKIYPESIADKSFDNTGMLLETPSQAGLRNSALLCIDLTKAVVDEALTRRDSLIVAYHPIIFRGLKSLTQGNSQTNSLLRLCRAGISVYSPHTAVDAAQGGLNDWLCDVVGAAGPSSRSNITDISSPPSGFEKAGYGRILRFDSPQSLGHLVKAITSSLGVTGVSVATPQNVPAGQKSSIYISSVGICAGSGGSMLGGLDVDLLFTGELGHHEALAAIEKGQSVITTFHSNTERAYLRAKMQPLLVKEVKEEIVRMAEKGEWKEEFDFDIGVSEVDADPFSIVMQGDKQW